VATEWTLRFRDHFDNAIPPSGIDWKINPPGSRNGAITEPPGSNLVLSWGAAVDTSWKTGVALSPYAAYVLSNGNHSWISGVSRTFRAELKIDTFSGGNYQEGGIIIYDANIDLPGLGYYGFLFGWNNNNNQVTIRQDQYVLGVQTHTQIANTGSFSWPGSIFLRYYYNPYKSGGEPNQPTTLDDVDGYVLQPGWAAFYYANAGGTFIRLLAHDTRALPFGFQPWHIGPWAGNRDSTTPAGSWGFDYLSLHQEPDVVPGPVPSDSGGTLRIETASAEEAVKVEVPGNTSLSTGSGTPVSELKPTASAEEAIRFIPPYFIGQTPTNRFPLTQLLVRAAPSEVITVAPAFPASAEESVRIVAGQTPTFHQGNSDSEGHVYFIGTRIIHQTYYDATKDVWHAPTPNFNGYGRDGYLYVNGVQQVTQAAWSTEGAGVDRSARRDFPLRSMICTTQKEIVIFDLDSWPTSIKVWMRFRLGADVSNYYMIGRSDNTIRKAVIKNGLMAVALLNTSWEVGGVVLIDFKTVGQYAANLVRSDNHWRLISGKTIANRNSTGLWETFSSVVRLSSNNVQWVDIFQLWSYWNDLSNYIVTGGEDGIEIIYYTSRTSTAQVDMVGGGPGRYEGTLAAGSDNTLYTPCVTYDEDGWLWWSSGPRVYRSAMDHLWAGNFIQGQSASLNYDARITSPYAELIHVFQNLPNPSVGIGDQVVCHVLCPVGRYIFAGTNVGVFRIDRVTLEWTFCYSVVGYLGGGRLNAPPAGEIIAGDQTFVGRLHGFRTTESDYLVVSTVQGMTSQMPYHQASGKGAVTIIRLFDDYAIHHVNPVLYEDGAWAVNGVLY